MVQHIFECKECGHKEKYGLFQLSAVVKCEHCGKEYLAIKNKLAMTLEIVVLFVIAMALRSFVFEASKINNLFLELAIVLVMLIIVNFLFDLLFTRVIKWKKYFTLVERATPIPPAKKNKGTPPSSGD